MVESIANFCELKTGLDGKFLLEITLSLGGEDIDAFISIDKTCIHFLVSLEIGCHSPVADIGSSILNKGIVGRVSSEHVNKLLG
jgi:hypothetical protein